MEWLIFADGKLIWDSRDSSGSYALSEPILTEALNSAGTLTFKIPVTHPLFDVLVEGQSAIKVEKDGDLVFRGRVLSISKQLTSYKEVVVEGALAVFNDTVAGPFKLTGAPSTILTRLVNDHNAQVDISRRFTVGTVDVPASPVTRRIDTRPLPSTWTALADRTVGSSLGGYLVLSGANLDVLNWLQSPSGGLTQALEFGENLMSLVHVADTADMVTAVEAYGAESEARDGNFLTLDPAHPSVRTLYVDGSGKAHYGVVDTALEAIIGRRVVSLYWQDVKQQSTLLNHANAELQARKNISIRVDANALEMALADPNSPEFHLGDLVPVTVPHMGISETLRVTEIVRHLTDNTGWVIKLGGERRSAMRNVGKNAQTVVELVHSNYRLNEWSDAADTRIKDTVRDVADAKATAIASLLAADNLIRDPVFESGSDGLGANVLLDQTDATVTPPVSYDTVGRWLANTTSYTVPRSVVPGHTYRIKAWLRPLADTIPAGAGQPSTRIVVYDAAGAVLSTSPWLPLSGMGNYTAVSWDWTAPETGVMQARLGFVAPPADFYVTGWSAQDVTAATEAKNALEGLRAEYESFTTETVQSLIEQKSDEIKLSVQTDRTIVAAILNEMQNSTAPGGDILATAVEQYISSFTVQDRSISMMFEELGTVTADVEGLATWQRDAQTWINFSASGIDMGRSETGYRVHIDDDELTFYTGDVQLATFTNQQLMVRAVNVTDSLRIGSMEWRPGARTGLWHLTGL